MKHLIDLETWNRKEHYLFFSKFDDPFFGITVNADVTKTYIKCKEEGHKLSLFLLHAIMKCVNDTRVFKLRIENGSIVEYDTINVSPTVGRTDGTFGYGFFPYNPEFSKFAETAELDIERVKSSIGLAFTDKTEGNNVIFYSAVPWLVFTEMKHATSFNTGDSVPRISTGKIFCEGDKYYLPISISCHHGLVDGRDISELIERLENMYK